MTTTTEPTSRIEVASAVEARGVSKSFGGALALQGSDLVARDGQVLAVLGENGAGKSTLMKVLAGTVRPDAGEVTVAGSPLRLGDPLAAEAAGIGAVFQELTIIPDLTVAQNIFLRNEPRRAGLISTRKLVESTEELFDGLGVTGIPPSRRGRDLTLAQKQIVEIAKVSARQPHVVILDEPTSALGEEQVEWLLGLVRDWRAEGRCVLLITHRFKEVKEIADVLGVYRAGRLVASYAVDAADDDEVMRAMCGRDVERMVPSPLPLPETAPTALSVEQFRCGRSRSTTDLELRAGEILGVGGLVGQGQLEFFRALFGDARYDGTIRIHGREVRIHRPTDAIRAGMGIALVPAERKTEGLLLKRSVRENIALASLKSFSRWGVLAGAREKAGVSDVVERLHIVTSGLRQPAGRLSGGNQQKAVIGKWLLSKSDVLLLFDVTRGVDIGAKEEIYKIVIALANQGAAVLYYSTDMEELLRLCHRVAVFHDGYVANVLEKADLTDTALVSAAFGRDSSTTVASVGPPMSTEEP
jgi:ribose transport system ATP-binding protein